MRAGRLLIVALMAILVLSGTVGESVYARNRKPHYGKFSHYKADKNAYLFGGKHKAAKKQKLPKKSYRQH